jgi:hypothetical protein
MRHSSPTLPAALAFNGAVFSWRGLFLDVLRVGHLRVPMPATTKLDAQAQWEAKQTIPLMITLMVAGLAAVASQMADVDSWASFLWIGVFAVCGLGALARVGHSYHRVFTKACLQGGMTAFEAEEAYQGRYRD